VVDPRASLALKLLFLLAVAYVAVPADLIPDVLPVIGWLDDLGIATLAVAFLLRTIRPYRSAPSPDQAVVETSGAEVR
jgi:uncharacterized membrane protein YkvA (DUF1232 family)